MKTFWIRWTGWLALGAGLSLLCSQARLGSRSGPDSLADLLSSESFSQATRAMKQIQNDTFGQATDRSIRNLAELSEGFTPYGIAGTTVINQEWERYQPFNHDNFVFTASSLNLTATIPPGGGLFAGGIRSGQIWTKQAFKPMASGDRVYAFEVRMKVPKGRGMWPAAWLYTQSPAAGMNDGSEIDHPEFFNMAKQNEFDWTGFNHGPGVGDDRFSAKTNRYVWHPGIDFSANYHDYQTVWTTDTVYKYVDDRLVYAQWFRWTAKGWAQFGVNLAVGTDLVANMPGLQPQSLSEFPAVLSIEHIKIWAE